VNPSSDAVDPSALDDLAEIDPDGSLLAELVELFCVETPRRIDVLKQAYRDGLCEAMTCEAHALKSSCAQLGALRLSEICQRLEILGRHGTLDRVAPLLPELDAGYAAAAEALRARVA
jgi:HPt (histidine-containing phosphotransfer) domain-containing protein